MSQHAPFLYETAASTHPGMVRHENEDAYLDDCASGVWAVADGMGGHQAGRLASSTVIEALRRIGPQTSAAWLLERCGACVLEANAELLRTAADRNTTIGTTLAALLVHDVHYACVWAGDSRIYLIRSGSIVLVSHDHTEVQDLVDQGIITEEERRTSPRRNVITRAIGVTTEPELELKQGVLAPGHTFVICSDGLTNHVADEEILGLLLARSAEDACHAMVGLAIERGGTDNVTAVVVRFRGMAGPAAGTVLHPA